VLVSADERDALIEVDGRAMGFTPAVINVQVGPRRVRVSMPGFRPVEREITVRQSAQERVDVALTRYEEVSAASRAAESVDDAPSSVSIVSSQELRAMGYPTIAEAVRGVRGVYLSDDHSYESLGFRGFGRPGDYGNRVLVLVDGHPTNDNWVNSSYVGYDARVDLDDVERIEVVRGPGSVLYGTGAFSGVINVVTRGRNAPNGGDVAASTNQYGVARTRAGLRLQSGSFGVWASASAAYGGGRDLYLPEYAQPATATTPASDGWSRNADGFVAGTFTGRLWYRDLTLQWLFNSRDKTIPTGVYDTLPGNPRTEFVDARGLAELRYEPRLGDTFQLLTRAYLNYYRFVERLAYDDADPNSDGYDTYRGLWAGAEVRGVWTPGRALRLTIGGEGVGHFIVRQTAGTVAAPEADDASDHPYQTAAAYVSADGSPTDWVRYSAAARLDWYSTFGATVNPRVALIFRPYARGNLKVMAGRAFRAPSIYEIYYTTMSARPNPDLAPETVLSGEVEFSHRISNTWTVLVAGYANYIENLIALRTTRKGMTDYDQYQNTASPVLTLGAEAEVRREWRQGWMLSASYAFQRSRYASSAESLREVPNAPEHLFAFRAAAPLVPQLFVASTRVTVEGPRWDRNDSATDPTQTRTSPSVVWDLVLSGRAERFGLRYALGVYNMFDWRYAVPMSNEFVRGDRRQSLTTMVQGGRTFLASASVDF
jgi:outer membrane receptor for ferrienterochelin and colicin